MSTTETTASLLDEITDLGLKAFDRPAAASNSWSGVDFHRAYGSTFRIYPTDGDWNAGFTFHELTHNGVCVATITYSGPASARRIIALVSAYLAN